MDYIKIRFGDDLDRIGSRLERTLQDFFGRSSNPMFGSKDCGWVPQMDIFETEKEVFLWAELAGVQKEDLEVEVNSKALRIHGLRKELPKPADGAYRLAEIRYGHFERVIYLPSPVDPEVVSSSFTNGFLSIRILKVQARKTHKVTISDG